MTLVDVYAPRSEHVLFTPRQFLTLDLPGVPQAGDRIGFAEDDPAPFAERVLEVLRVTWCTRPTDTGALAEVELGP